MKKINKKIEILTIIIASLVLLPSSVFALATTPTTTATTTPIVSPTITDTANTTTAIAKRKTLADQEITRRIAALNALVSKVETIKKLTPSEVGTYTADLQNEMNALTTLEAKINADTDSATLKTDVQSIVDSYRVYVVYIPQMWLLVTADRMSQTWDTFNTFAGKLSTRIQADAKQGENVTTLTTDYNQMVTQLSDLNTQIQNIITLANGLTPAGYPGNVTQMQTARSDVKKGQQDIVNALQESKAIITGLKGLETVPSVSNSPSITATPLTTTQ